MSTHINTLLVIQLADGSHRTTSWSRPVSRTEVLTRIWEYNRDPAGLVIIRALVLYGLRAPMAVPFQGSIREQALWCEEGC